MDFSISGEQASHCRKKRKLHCDCLILLCKTFKPSFKIARSSQRSNFRPLPTWIHSRSESNEAIDEALTESISFFTVRSEISEAAARLISSGARWQAFLEDLRDYNRMRFGMGIQVRPVPMDAALVLSDELNLPLACGIPHAPDRPRRKTRH